MGSFLLIIKKIIIFLFEHISYLQATENVAGQRVNLKQIKVNNEKSITNAKISSISSHNYLLSVVWKYFGYLSSHSMAVFQPVWL